MPSRLLMTNVPPLELVASIVLLIATIVLFSWVSIKIYSAAILNYGNRPEAERLYPDHEKQVETSGSINNKRLYQQQTTPSEKKTDVWLKTRRFFRLKH